MIPNKFSLQDRRLDFFEISKFRFETKRKNSRLFVESWI